MLNAETRLRSGAPRRDGLQDQVFHRIVEFSIDDVDQGLPAWARRSHPIIRRHLGAYWKTFTPDVSAMGRMYALLAALTLITVFIPTFYTLLVPTVTVSLVMLPIAGYLYAGLLYKVGTFAVTTTNNERRHNTLNILRATPYPMREILLSKGASAIWRFIEDLNLVALSVLLTSLPLLLIMYNAMLQAHDSPLLIALVVVVALASFTVRVILETIMVAALGLLMGAANFTRSAGVLSTLLITIGYFVLINMMRLLPFGVGFNLLMELIIPLVFPLIITVGCVIVTTRLLERD